MQKAVFVKATFNDIIRQDTEKEQVGSRKNIFGANIPVYEARSVDVVVGKSETEIDGERLAGDVNIEIAKLNADGYSVISLQSITSSNQFSMSVPVKFFSYTEGVLILATRDAEA